jgi:hypothetical protein
LKGVFVDSGARPWKHAQTESSIDGTPDRPKHFREDVYASRNGLHDGKDSRRINRINDEMKMLHILGRSSYTSEIATCDVPIFALLLVCSSDAGQMMMRGPLYSRKCVTLSRPNFGVR